MLRQPMVRSRADLLACTLLDGFGPMGNHALWFSSVIGTALLSIGTTELSLVTLALSNRIKALADFLNYRAFGSERHH